MPVGPGQSLSQYRLVEVIGEGGMGVVWKAFDTDLNRHVAVKILPPEWTGSRERILRFRREAQAAAALNHPGIAVIHEVGEENGTHFLVMELVVGETLRRRMGDRPMPPRDWLRTSIPIAEALAHAHQGGVVHRDLKPDNVMVTPEGGVKILDFGLARLLQSEQLEESPARKLHSRLETISQELTRVGHVFGTVAYMSPEQARGERVDHRSDLFSFGVLLYQMASGRLPFQARTQIETLSSIIRDEPPPLSEVAREIPAEAERVVRKAMEKVPERRYQHADEMATDLRNLLRDLETGPATITGVAASARPPGPGSQWGRRLKYAAPPVLVAVAVLSAYLALFRQDPGGPPTDGRKLPAGPAFPDRKMLVVLPFENLGAPADEYFADGITEEITSRLAALDGLAVISRTSAMQYKESRPSLPQIGRDLGVDYVLEGTVRWQRFPDGPSRVRVTPQLIQVSEDIHVWAERYDGVLEDIFEVQSDIARQVSEQLGIALLEPQQQSLDARPTGNLDAYDAYLRGNDFLHRGREVHSAREIQFAIQQYTEAVRLDPEFALAHARESVAHLWLFEFYYDRTGSRLARARQAMENAVAIDPGLPEAHFALGRMYFAAEKNHQRALEEFEQVLESQPSSAEVYEAISRVHLDLGNWREGAAIMKKAIKLSPRQGRFACWTGGRYFGLREFGPALDFHERAIRLTPSRACPYFCKLNIYLNRDGDTGNARRFLGKLPDGIGLEETPPINYTWVQIEMFDREYEAALERLASGPAGVFEFDYFYLPKEMIIAEIQGLMGQPELARMHFEAARDLIEEKIRVSADDHRLHSALGIVYAGLGRRDEAVREGRLGIELLHGGKDERLGYRLKDMAQIFLMVGEPELAIDQIEHLLSVPALFAAPYMELDPIFDPIRDNPRFLALLEKHKEKA